MPAPKDRDSTNNPGGRLTDPRPVQPGPEGEWPFPSRTPGPPDASPGPDVREPQPDDPEDAGLVDPRPEAAGPDVVG
jgi:hypothetical protein